MFSRGKQSAIFTFNIPPTFENEEFPGEKNTLTKKKERSLCIALEFFFVSGSSRNSRDFVSKKFLHGRTTLKVELLLLCSPSSTKVLSSHRFLLPSFDSHGIRDGSEKYPRVLVTLGGSMLLQLLASG